MHCIISHCTYASIYFSGIATEYSLLYNTITPRARAQAESNEGGRKEWKMKAQRRSTDWLTAQGFPPEKVLDCIKYIAGDSEPSNASTPRKE